jgi:hypothetical protein
MMPALLEAVDDAGEAGGVDLEAGAEGAAGQAGAAAVVVVADGEDQAAGEAGGADALVVVLAQLGRDVALAADQGEQLDDAGELDGEEDDEPRHVGPHAEHGEGTRGRRRCPRSC